MEGAGRGRIGRGTALLQALKRRPEETGGQPGGDGVAPGTAAAPAVAPPVVPGPAGDAPAPIPRPMGRGAAALALVSLRKPTVPGSGPDAPAAPVSAPQPVVPSRPQAAVEPPVEQFRRLRCTDIPTGNPSLGTDGSSIQMAANYIRLNIAKGMGIYEYHVTFTPNVESKGARFKLMNQLREVTGGAKTFDGVKLYLPKLLPEQVTVLTAKHPMDDSVVTVVLKFIKQGQLEKCIHLYNVLFRRIMRILQMHEINRSYFDPRLKVAIPQHRLEVWPGYITAAQEMDGGLMLVADVSHRVLRTQTVRDLMSDILHSNPQNFKDEVEKALTGVSVLTRYNNKNYKVDDIMWDMNPLSTFMLHNGEETNFVDYYQKAYNITIRDLEQPLLLNKPKPKRGAPPDTPPSNVCLIPELSFICGLTDDIRADFRVMKDISQHTRVTPNQRELSLRKFVVNVNKSDESRELLAQWGLTLDERIIPLEGRLFQPEKIHFKNRTIVADKTADWGREIGRDEVISAVPFRKWVLVFTKRDAPRARELVACFHKICPAFGIQLSEPIISEASSDRTEAFLKAIRDSVNPEVQIVVIIFPSPRDDRYNAVKKLCCVEQPIPSQCINSRTISQPQKLRSIAQKIALQMNCKLGGELWALTIPLNKVMICGVDVFHDTNKKSESWLGFVASLNASITRWFSKASKQSVGHAEMASGLRALFGTALTEYYKVNHTFPERIILFRDGVSDGEMETVAGFEIDQIKSCFPQFQADYNPKLTVIVVQKRINTRLFGILGRDLDNPPPGSVVDHTVTKKGWYDFYLISQHVRQGTVSPTHYVVVYDNSNMKPDHVQRLTYKMTHLYYNWCGTVRVPAPCQYAHKLAHLIGKSIHKETSAQLSDRLFYL